jgi:uncharacterized protein YegL
MSLISLLDAVESIPRKTTVVFLALDVSSSLTEQKLRVFLEAVHELKDTLRRQSETAADCQVKIAALQFDVLCSWSPPEGPVDAAQFAWQIPFTDKPPTARFDEMCGALNGELSRKRFMTDAAGYYPPVIVLFSGADYTLPEVLDGEGRAAAEEALQKLHKNNWFKYADKCAVALGKTADRKLLAEWTGDEETVFEANTPSALRRIIASINMPRLSMPSTEPDRLELTAQPHISMPAANSEIVECDLPLPDTAYYADRAREYKKALSRNFISLNPNKIDEYLGNDIFFVTRKYDGELALVFFDNGNASAYNSGGTPLPDLPCLREAAACIRGAGIQNASFAAELYLDEAKGRTRVFDTIAALASPERHGDLRLAFFDILKMNGAEWNKQFEEIYTTLSKIFNTKQCAPVRCEKVSSKEKVKQLFGEWVTKEGGEGLVIRSGGQMAIKIKPRMSVDAAVIGFSESDTRGSVRTLLYALRNEDGSFQVIGRVGNGLTEEQRVKLFNYLMPLKIKSNYIEVDSNHAVFHIIKPELVVELSANDAICENSQGLIKNPLLELQDGYFGHCGAVPGYSLVSAVIERFRNDKTSGVTDVRLSQLEERAFNPLAKKERIPETHAPSQILVREVYRKESKSPMVMKFLVWKTNKEHEGNYPAYVFSYTNFSVSRADPLSLEVRVSNSEAQIMGFYRDYAAKNVKAGWTRQ